MCFRRPKYIETAKNASAGSIDVSSLTTGDILIFSDNWSDSSVKRMVRNANDKLWVSGGIVINAPTVFQDVMLLQHDLRKKRQPVTESFGFHQRGNWCQACWIKCSFEVSRLPNMHVTQNQSQHQEYVPKRAEKARYCYSCFYFWNSRH